VFALLDTFGAALVAGTGFALVVYRWPAADPGSPAGATHAVAARVRGRAALSAYVRRRIDPATATGVALLLGLATIVVVGVILGVLTYMVRTKTGLVVLDRGVANWGLSNSTDLSNTVLRAVTSLGSTVVVVALAIVVGVVEYRRAPSRAIPAFLALVVIGQNVVNNTVKALVDRARPDIHPLAGFSGASFPSGHTAAAAACYAAFALLLSRRRSVRTRAVLAGVAIAVTTAVAATRVILGVHWLTDVLAGAALGWGWFALSAIAFGGRLLHFGAPVEAAQRVEGAVDRVTQVTAPSPGRTPTRS
jgi:membrane-associated phospholipid phosphatase